MVTQIIAECKKVLKNKWIWIIYFILILIIFQTGSTRLNSVDYFGYRDDGSYVEGSEAKEYLQGIAETYEGKMDAAWYSNFDKDLREAQKDNALFCADEKRMIENYGENWLDIYLENSDSFYVDDGSNQYEKEDKKPFYKKSDLNRGGLLRNDFLITLNANYVGMIKEKRWNNDTNIKSDVIGKTDAAKDAMYWQSKSTDEDVKVFVLAELNEQEVFEYGNSDGWELLISLFESAYFLLPMFIILVTSNMFNKERSSHMIEVMKTCTYGKRKTAYAKICASILIALGACVSFICISTFYVMMKEGLGNWNALYSIIINAINSFTIKEVFLGSILLFLSGSIIVAITSSFISCIVKSSYISLIVSVLVFVLPLFLTFEFATLFPINLMEIESIFASISVIHIFDNFYMITDVVWIWIIPVVLLCGGTIIAYRSYSFQK